MRPKVCILSFILLTSVASVLATKPATSAPTEPAAGAGRVFEVRTYTTLPGRLEALEARFREHTTKLFEKHGMTNIGYWTPADEPRSKDTLVYILAHPSREAARKNWEAFLNDPEWHKARDASEQAGPIVNKVESMYLEPIREPPQLVAR